MIYPSVARHKNDLIEPKEVNLVVDLNQFYYLVGLYFSDRQDQAANALIQLALIAGHAPNQERISEEMRKLKEKVISKQ